MSVKNEMIKASVTVIANMQQLATHVVKGCAGVTVSNSMQNDTLTVDAVRTMVAARIAHNMNMVKPD